jgi:adenine-specific DNA-methyltransferase
MLIHGDNLLALKALEQDFAGKIKCIYIDPPFNTGAAFDHYDDSVEHSIWLNLMKERFTIINRLLSPNGILFVHLDDSEMAYAKVLLDQVFGRSNYCNTISMTTNDPSGFKATASTIFQTGNYLLVYAKNKTNKSIQKVWIEKDYDTAYSKVMLNKEAHYSEWKWTSINEIVAKELGFESAKKAKKELEEAFDGKVAEYAIKNAENVFRTAAIGGGAAIKRAVTINRSITEKDKVLVHPNEDVPNFYILNGGQILFYDKRLIDVDGAKVPGEVITDVWTDISWTGIAPEGDVNFKNGKKPELLIKRVLDMSTVSGDWVLDSFLGSGTTASVANKLGRNWIGIELGEHANTHCIPRLKSVIDGSDNTGISKSINWKGGGGFKFYNLAPSLLRKDTFGNFVIDEKYNSNMLAAAMCKHEGFKFYPDETLYWKHGKSTETDFIFVTTGFITAEQLDKVHSEMKAGESLLICAKAFAQECENHFTNITIKKIPQMILGRCEFGKDNYDLNIIKATEAEAEESNEAKEQ